MESQLCLVKEWNPATWTLSEAKEVFVPKVATLGEFGQIMTRLFFTHIPNN